MSRVLGVDLGTRRVGLAISDRTRTVATPLETIDAGDAEAPRWPERLAQQLAEVAARTSSEMFVVGLPRSLSGRDTASTRMARTVAKALEAQGWRVALWDERLSSAEAERSLVEAGVAGPARREGRDRVAAALILQGWLDAGGS